MFRVADKDAIAGQIVWIKNRLAALKFDCVIDPETFLGVPQELAPVRRRSFPRLKVAARAVLRTGGRNLPAVLCDISSIGAKVRTSQALRDNLAVVLDLPDLPSLKAVVRWTHGIESGVAFENPLPMPIIANWIDGRMKVSV